MKALGFVEVPSVTGAVDCLDLMCKAANVELVTWERKLGGRLVTLVITGEVDAVNAALDATVSAVKTPVAKAIIARPHEETIRLVELSASRLKK